MAHFSVKTHTPRTPFKRHEVKPPLTASHEEIARLAYAYWESRGRGHGCPHEDWYRAELEIRKRIANKG